MRPALLLTALGVACGPPPCDEGYEVGPSGGCVVAFDEPCPGEQVRDATGTCVDPFTSSDRPPDTAGETDVVVETGDTGRTVGDRCAWRVVISTTTGGAEVGWSILDERDRQVAVEVPGAYGDAEETQSDPIELEEGIGYTFRAVDTGADGWEGGAFRVVRADDPTVIAVSNTLASGSEGLFPFNVLCPAR